MSDFVAVTTDRFAAVTDALGPVDCARRPPSYQLHPPSSPSHPLPSHYRHSLPAHVDVGVQVNERFHPFSPVTPSHPSENRENIATSENAYHDQLSSPGLHHHCCAHKSDHHPSTFRASISPFYNVADADANGAVSGFPAHHAAPDVFLIDGNDYVSRLVDIVTSHAPLHSKPLPSASHTRIHSTPLPSQVPSPTTPDAADTDRQPNDSGCTAVVDPVDDTDTNAALVSNALKLARPFEGNTIPTSFGVSRASTLMSTLSLGAPSIADASPSTPNVSSQTSLLEERERIEKQLQDEEERLISSQFPMAISPHLFHFPDVLAIPSMSPCRSPSPISNLRQQRSRSSQAAHSSDRICKYRAGGDVVRAAAAAHALLHAATDDHDERLSDAQPFPPSESDDETVLEGSSVHPISSVDSASRLERVSELFREDEYENDDDDDLHREDNEEGDLLQEIPSNPSIFVAVTSARTLSDLVSLQDDECSSSRLDCDGEDKDEITPIAHRVIPSLWLRPQSAPCPRSDPSPALTSVHHAPPQVSPNSAPLVAVSDANAEEESSKVSGVSKSDAASGNDGGSGNVEISPRRGNGAGKGGNAGAGGSSGSVSLSPSRLFRKSWTKRKSNESSAPSSNTEYYEDDYLKFMEGSCPSSKPPLRLLPHPAFARLIGADGRALRASRFDCSESSISVSTSDEEYRPFCGNSS